MPGSCVGVIVEDGPALLKRLCGCFGNRREPGGKYMNLQHVLPFWFFQWCEKSAVGLSIQGSKWTFAVIETIHIMALAVLLGSFLLVDLRLFGLGMRRQTIAEVASQFAPTSWVSFAVMVATGIPMYLSEAVRLSSSAPFFYKMVFLF